MKRVMRRWIIAAFLALLCSLEWSDAQSAEWRVYEAVYSGETYRYAHLYPLESGYVCSIH